MSNVVTIQKCDFKKGEILVQLWRIWLCYDFLVLTPSKLANNFSKYYNYIFYINQRSKKSKIHDLSDGCDKKFEKSDFALNG